MDGLLIDNKQLKVFNIFGLFFQLLRRKAHDYLAQGLVRASLFSYVLAQCQGIRKGRPHRGPERYLPNDADDSPLGAHRHHVSTAEAGDSRVRHRWGGAPDLRVRFVSGLDAADRTAQELIPVRDDDTGGGRSRGRPGIALLWLLQAELGYSRIRLRRLVEQAIPEADSSRTSDSSTPGENQEAETAGQCSTVLQLGRRPASRLVLASDTGR